MKKIFKGFNLTWPKLIIMAVFMGIYTAAMAMLHITADTSFRDITVTFEVWILFGIFIIINSKSNLDSALKCFVFFLISQPLVYLIQDVINDSQLFSTYYKYWFMWTIGCVPMGFVGYYMKRDKWWGLLILTPILVLLGTQYSHYLSELIFSFPRHILTVIFCIATLISYPLVIFKNKRIRIVGVIISAIIIVAGTIVCLIKPPIYSTEVLFNSEKHPFDDTYQVYLIDKKYGELSIKYEEPIDSWVVHAELKRAGKTQFVLVSPDGKKTTFNIAIERDRYTVKEVNN